VDTNQRDPTPRKLGAGAAAEISPDGTKVAFVAPNGQLSVISAVTDAAKPVQISFGAKSPSHLAWTPDGKRVAFETTDGVESVSAAPAGAGHNPATKLSTKPGVPTFAPLRKDRLVRVGGTDAIEAAIVASKMRWSDQPLYQPNESGHQAVGALLTGLTGV